MIEERLENIDTLKGKFQLLSRSEVIEDFNFLRSIFKSRAICNSEKDFSDSTKEEIIKWFKELKIDEAFVKIYWHSFNEGISIGFETFIRNFDEIWYPSSDDVWITGDSKSWLIQIDHEEMFCFFNFG